MTYSVLGIAGNLTIYIVKQVNSIFPHVITSYILAYNIFVIFIVLVPCSINFQLHKIYGSKFLNAVTGLVMAAIQVQGH